MKARCPRNYSHHRFITVAHVAQDWIVDENGDFLEEISTLETVHGPNVDNIWACAICNAEAIVSE